MQLKSPPIPEGLDVLQEGAAAIIRRSWFSHVVWFLLFFCIAWDSFLVFWYRMALGGAHHGPFSLLAVIFPIGHVAVGVGLTYFVLCTFFNKTDLILTPSCLRIKTYPLPWLGNRSLQAAEMIGFSYRQRTRSNDGTTSFSHDLMYVDAFNREKTLWKSLPNQEQAEFICNALTQFYFPGQ